MSLENLSFFISKKEKIANNFLTSWLENRGLDIQGGKYHLQIKEQLRALIKLFKSIKWRMIKISI